ncbi:asb030 [Agrotis segetum nucleopolyhedrovirus B]|uniref:Asb030 n=1 Tax=Agrotis segetum nucleopolyhedrovirus B TaxID=1580580 RepID=A0A0A7KR52_9ABAC|nr:asb030 [Agrotis segetum nucleopolyhedrovirus B]AIZ48588.1 asb030 [Agrotis segetum nucleopolyhedrovirus B]
MIQLCSPRTAFNFKATTKPRRSRRTFVSCSNKSSSIMYTFRTDHVKVFVDDDNFESPHVSVQCDERRKVVTFNYNLQSSCRIRVTLASGNKYIQGVFQCGTKRMCVVNVRDRRLPLMFDGFIDSEDECRTTSFVVGNLKELRDNHGLRVREMARAMESPIVLRIFINEAIISTPTNDNYDRSDTLANNCKDDDYYELDLLMKRLKISERNEENTVLPYRTKSLNNTRWAPVSCKTGTHLLTVNLTFTITSSTILKKL